jgi:hypothetical protein
VLETARRRDARLLEQLKDHQFQVWKQNFRREFDARMTYLAEWISERRVSS